ncbi:hypothetical protein [Herbiconiux sp.]|uniref:hypothetical protein n=1 Tax=Herbiconiux sp. TaxID=1871186 RepID=UPI0025C6D9AC|nr:hypothetical protein [Herbiconiux sp.]
MINAALLDNAAHYRQLAWDLVGEDSNAATTPQNARQAIDYLDSAVLSLVEWARQLSSELEDRGFPVGSGPID